MEPRIFRFFQYIESILSNFVAGKEISAKIRAANTSCSAATPDRKETGNEIAGDGVAGKKIAGSFRTGRPPCYTQVEAAISNLFFKKENFSSGIFFLFIGFVIGNLFGTFLPAIRIFFSWDGFIVLFLLFFIEFISYVRYQRKSRFFLILWNFRRRGKPISFRGINFQPPILFGQKGFVKEKVFLNLEESPGVQGEAKIPTAQLGNERIVAKKEKQNGNKTAFSSNFPFFRISLFPLFSNEGTTTFVERSLPFPFSSYLKDRRGLLPIVTQSVQAASLKSLNYFKIGFLLGFFIDAYKVGS